jgi:MFS family permease
MASSYLLANAASLPLWGKLSDIWGRRPVILAANFLFLAGSLVSALAAGAAVLIAGRCIQGLGGGGLIVLSQICVSDLFSISERPKYYAMFGAVWAVAGASGPVIGGSLAQEVAWRWCFYINRMSPASETQEINLENILILT